MTNDIPARYVLLLRGINVGGRNKLPMKSLVGLLESLGCRSVATYIQSGNAVFEGQPKPWSSPIARAIEQEFGFSASVLCLTAEHFLRAIEATPFDTQDGKTLHLYFLESTPKSPNLEKLDALRSATERTALLDQCFYLYAPDGVGRSKLAATAERHLGVTATARNWNTVQKLRHMLEQKNL
ncbi:MAG: DUF1697 domain-containing protein [Pseudomonadota bacterium]